MGQGNAAALGPPGTKPPGHHSTGHSQWDGNWGREGEKGWSVGLRGLMPDGAIRGRHQKGSDGCWWGQLGAGTQPCGCSRSLQGSRL